ncbi:MULTISPECIES: sigma 54-interacting transcriptional regulator [Klebsiella pneumoniae complex]|uniref:sigma 54-interacting transcriptional regulator n=1 Tax=Klebsiella variicola TaxID=244366 RepID=UPI000E2C5A8D|nr:NtrC family Transcriptional regulator [Klebsiella pneumoniae]SXF64270.1 NtrC family Transcriptional regulator [Klebsiella variicola]
MALSAKEKLFNKVITHYAESRSGFTAQDCADFMQVNRSVVSHYLNRLCDDGRLRKENTRPVRFFVIRNVAAKPSFATVRHNPHDAFSGLIGHQGSLAEATSLCRSAVDYPGRGLPVLLAGESGVGKSHLASLVYQYALERGVICQQRVKSDPLTVTTNGLILIHLVYSGLASAITPAFRFCFSR